MDVFKIDAKKLIELADKYGNLGLEDLLSLTKDDESNPEDMRRKAAHELEELRGRNKKQGDE